MKNVLVLNTTGMGYEGISSVIMNYIENMDLSGISLNVAVVPTTKPELIERIEKIAAVHLLPQKKQDTKGYMKELSKLLKSGIDVFHSHGNSGMMFPPLAITALASLATPSSLMNGSNPA